jgi:transcriptional regulator with XRE-family HTH domain
MEGAMKQYPYKSYVFRSTDPILDELQPLLRSMRHSELSKLSGVSATTMSNWKRKRTRRPQFATVSAVALAAGCYGISFVDGKPVLQHEPIKRLKVVK